MVLPTTEIIESFLYYTLIREQHHTLTTPQKLDIESLTFVVSLFGSLSTVVGDEKLTSREDRIGPFFMYVQCDEDTLLKVDKVSKTEAQTFDVFDQLISRFKFRV